MQRLADNLWVFRYPLNILGTKVGRTVTVMRLRSGQLIIHSTAPFSRADVEAISALGSPGWLVEATLFHDTYARKGQAAFPNVPYLHAGPNGDLLPAPAAWAGELEILLVDGMPKVREHVFLHRPSRTLITADLVFNFGPQASGWTRWFFRNVAGTGDFPGMSRMFRFFIKDRAAFKRSAETMLDWDFDRVIVAHGDIIETNGKQKLKAALKRALG